MGRPVAALTGGTGFLGRYLVRALDRAGFRVRLLARQDPVHPLLQPVALELVPGDLFSDEALDRLVAGASVVVHAAGLIKAVDRAGFFRVNEGGSARLGQAVARSASAARLLLVSSQAAREPTLSDYAASKHAGERAAIAAIGAGEWLVVRPPAIYGPWDRETLALFRAASGPLVPVPGGPEARIAMIEATDCAAAVAALARPGGPEGRVFELADGNPAGYGWGEILDAAAAAVGRLAVRVRVPGPALAALGLAGTAKAWATRRPVMLTVGKVREIRHCDWSVASSNLPPLSLWRPSSDIVKGFAAAVAWYRAEGWL